ncbi:hypothetical protein OG288_39605 [Streptomyces tauricus]|uniref:Uncharacterized protein n=1 Tax=Streptomyces tauricus TaxID=68274 RepID=A0ABZ1JVH6_9ACTN|nr:hypothetical protein [Streptomyces tauricus]
MRRIPPPEFDDSPNAADANERTPRTPLNRPPEFGLPEFPQQEFPISTVTPADPQTRPAPETAQEWIDRVTEAAAVLATAARRRTVRIHTLHDPVAYKRREVGRLVLEVELPEPTWYS